MKHRNNDFLVKMAVADAFTASVETLPPSAYPDGMLEKLMAFDDYVPSFDGHVRTSFYTDDTEMSAANAHVLLESEAPFSARAFADAYLAEFHFGGQRHGYAKRFQAFLPSCLDGADFLARINPTSDKNGAAMRSVPLGVLPSPADVLAVATRQAAITHDTPAGLFSARAIALMSHFSLYEDASLDYVGEYCLRHLPAEDTEAFGRVFTERWGGGPIETTDGLPLAVVTVWTVVDLVKHCKSCREVIECTLRWGGDTDSSACLAAGILSARHQDECLPEFMERDLEGGNPVTGTLYLRQLGTQLMDMFA